MGRKRRKPKKSKPRILTKARLATAAVLLLGSAVSAAWLLSGAKPHATTLATVRLALPPPPAPPRPVTAPAAIEPPVVREPVALRPAPAPPAVMPPAVTPPAVAPPAGVPAWRRLAMPAPAFDGRPLIAVVIDDLGLDRRRSARAVSLPGPLTLAWLPYASNVTAQAAAGRAAGHETLLHAPMQPLGSEDPGPQALTTDLAGDEVRRRIGHALALLPFAVGLNNHMGSQFTRDARVMNLVLAELRARGLLFLDSLTSGASVGSTLAREHGVPHTVRDVFLDNENVPQYVSARLGELEDIARRRGAAVGIGHPHDATLDVLESWLRSIAARGFALAPISAIVRYRQEHPEPVARTVGSGRPE